MKALRALCAVLLTSSAFLALSGDALAVGTNERVSVTSDEAQASGASDHPSVGDDGRYVAFASDASDLVASDTNGRKDVFVRDRLAGTTTRVSVASDGTQANHESDEPAISGNGRFVAFVSVAGNLVASDTNGAVDVFVKDLQTGAVERVNRASDGSQSSAGSPHDPSMSDDGRFVAFSSTAGNLVSDDTNLDFDIFVHDRDTDQTTRVSVASNGAQGSGASFAPSITGDGRYVVFDSYAANLVPNDTNGARDVFVHDRNDGSTIRASVGSGGTQANGDSFAPAISEDGRVVVFASTAGNLPHDPDDPEGGGVGVWDVFLRDLDAGTTEQVNGGLYVGYEGLPTADGSAVHFLSTTGSGRLMLFRYERATRTSVPLLQAAGGGEPNGDSDRPSISEDGRFLAYMSLATNLVGADSNSSGDVFLHDFGFVLGVTTQGTGAGRVTADLGGIACGAGDGYPHEDDCSENYGGGAVVALTADPDTDSTFDGWSGACTNSVGPCTVTMDQARSVTANFGGATVLTVSAEGGQYARITSSPAGIDCPGDCSGSFPSGTEVTMTVTSTWEGWVYNAEWTGACEGQYGFSCTLTMDHSDGAEWWGIFMPNDTYEVEVTSVGSGTGVVASTPAGIDCGAVCRYDFEAGTTVTLAADAALGSVFAGWSGACANATGTCTVEASPNVERSATARFEAVPTHELTVAKAGNGSGRVTSAPGGIDCGATCSTSVNEGTELTLTADPTVDSEFTGWSGGGCGGTGTCVVTMDAARLVTAAFDLKRYALTVAKTGSGFGAVTTTSPGISCGSDCVESYDAGTEVTLVAVPSDGSTFVRWTGACQGSNQACVVTMDQARSLTAEFLLLPPATVYRPDGVIKLSSASSYKGNDVYNTTGSNQTVSVKTRRGTVKRFDVKIHNNGNVTDGFVLKGASGSNGFTVKYFVGSTNVTATVTGGTFTIDQLAPGASKALKIVIAATSRARVNSSKAVLLTASSASQGSSKDAVRAVVKAT